MKIYALFNKLGRLVTGGSVKLKPRVSIRQLKLQDAAVEKQEYGDWEVLDVKGSKILPMTTMLGEPTPSFPVGVFNVKKQYLGIANTGVEFASLWNADAENRKLATLSHVGNTGKFIVQRKTKQTPALYGLRFYQFEASGNFHGNIGYHSYVQIGTDPVVHASSLNISTQYRISDFRALRTYYGRGWTGGSFPLSKSPWRVDAKTKYLVIGKVLPSTWTTIKVFHNEYGVLQLNNVDDGNFPKRIGGAPGLQNLSGKLPKHLSVLNLHLWNPHPTVIPGYESRTPTNFDLKNTNISELDSLRVFGIQSWAYASIRSLLPANIDNIKKTVEGLQLQFDAAGLDAWDLYGDNWPRLKAIQAIYSKFNTPLFLAAPPKFTRYVDVTAAGLVGVAPTSTNVDDLAISLEARTRGIVPEGYKFLWITGWNAAFTTASAQARAALIARGWSVA